MFFIIHRCDAFRSSANHCASSGFTARAFISILNAVAGSVLIISVLTGIIITSLAADIFYANKISALLSFE